MESPTGKCLAETYNSGGLTRLGTPATHLFEIWSPMKLIKKQESEIQEETYVRYIPWRHMSYPTTISLFIVQNNKPVNIDTLTR